MLENDVCPVRNKTGMIDHYLIYVRGAGKVFCKVDPEDFEGLNKFDGIVKYNPILRRVFLNVWVDGSTKNNIELGSFIMNCKEDEYTFYNGNVKDLRKGNLIKISRDKDNEKKSIVENCKVMEDVMRPRVSNIPYARTLDLSKVNESNNKRKKQIEENSLIQNNQDLDQDNSSCTVCKDYPNIIEKFEDYYKVTIKYSTGYFKVTIDKEDFEKYVLPLLDAGYRFYTSNYKVQDVRLAKGLDTFTLTQAIYGKGWTVQFVDMDKHNFRRSNIVVRDRLLASSRIQLQKEEEIKKSGSLTTPQSIEMEVSSAISTNHKKEVEEDVIEKEEKEISPEVLNDLNIQELVNVLEKDFEHNEIYQNLIKNMTSLIEKYSSQLMSRIDQINLSKEHKINIDMDEVQKKIAFYIKEELSEKIRDVLNEIDSLKSMLNTKKILTNLDNLVKICKDASANSDISISKLCSQYFDVETKLNEIIREHNTLLSTHNNLLISYKELHKTNNKEVNELKKERDLYKRNLEKVEQKIAKLEEELSCATENANKYKKMSDEYMKAYNDAVLQADSDKIALSKEIEKSNCLSLTVNDLYNEVNLLQKKAQLFDLLKLFDNPEKYKVKFEDSFNEQTKDCSNKLKISTYMKKGRIKCILLGVDDDDLIYVDVKDLYKSLTNNT